MSNYQWYLTKKREELLKEAMEIPEVKQRGYAWCLEWALSELVQKHKESQNPQTKIELFKTGLENAIPNIYREREAFEKFYRLISSPEEYKELDKQINMILNIHNRNLERF